MSEPCCKCGSEATGPSSRTPYGICEPCACWECRGFSTYDDRGNLYTGSWPSLFFTKCLMCGGTGLRSSAQSTIPATPKSEEP